MKSKLLAYLSLVLACVLSCSQTAPTSNVAADSAVPVPVPTAGSAVVPATAIPCGDEPCGTIHSPPKAKIDARTPAQKTADAAREVTAACTGSKGEWLCSNVPHKQLMGVGNATAAQCGPACTVTTWAFDPANTTGCASDANSCTSTTCGGNGIGPCVTFGQIVTRLGSTSPVYPSSVVVTFNQLSSQSAGQDPIFFEPQVSGGGQAILVGQRVAFGAPFALGAGTAAKVRGAPGSLTLADMSAGPGGILKNMLVVNTSRSSQALIDSFAGGTATMQQPCTTASLTSTAAIPAAVEDDLWANGQTVQLYTLVSSNLKRWRPKGGDLSVGGAPSGGWIEYLSVADTSGAGSSVYVLWSESAVNVAVNCVFQARLDLGSAGGRGNFAYALGCSSIGLVFCVDSSGNFQAGAMAAGTNVDGHLVLLSDVIIHGASSMGVSIVTFNDVYSDGTWIAEQTYMDIQASAPNLGYFWGSWSMNITAGSIITNLNGGGTWASKSALTSGTLEINGGTVGSSYLGGQFTNNITVTPANLDIYHSLQDPRSGALYTDQTVDTTNIAANHVQGNTANAVASNPVLSSTISITCVGPNRKVRVWATAYPLNSVPVVAGIQTAMTLVLDGSPVVGAPVPTGNAFAAGQVGWNAPQTYPTSTPLTIAWDVTFPDNMPHTLGVSVAGTGGTGFLSLTDGSILAQELLNWLIPIEPANDNTYPEQRVIGWR